ncbi:hypothetical protein L839_0587 [Mycobacterium avium MAV_120809_2495]|nr:hypothetical protein L839_5069 [Mycobacterium avium MAV_120809_2495]ETZ55221.1 hypothetical protein L839_0587 [Mycobacterium avium MAV_120809_2495]
MAVAAMNAFAPQRRTVLADKPRWRLTEEEIVGASMSMAK